MRYALVGASVHMWWNVAQSDTDYWTCPTRLPEGLRPTGNTYMPAVLTNSSGYATNNVALACVQSDGVVGFQAAAAISGALNRGSGCFLVKS